MLEDFAFITIIQGRCFSQTKNVGGDIKRGNSRNAIIAVTRKTPGALRGKLLGGVVILGIDRNFSDHKLFFHFQPES